MILLSILILSLPTLWELFDDRHGESLTEKAKDVPRRAFLMIVSAMVVAFILMWSTFPWRTNEHVWPYTILSFKSAFLSFAIFFLTFDYGINLILGRKPWYSYLSQSRLDRLASKVDWRLRMAIRVAVFVASLVWFLNK